MGRRALVAYRRPDGLVDARYSHWGGAEPPLSELIGPERPFGDGRIDGRPLARETTVDTLLTSVLDPVAYESFSLVSTRYEVTSYRVVRLDRPAESVRARGALVPVGRDVGLDPRAFDDWFRTTRAVLADFVAMNVVPRTAALAYLEARTCLEFDAAPYEYCGPPELVDDAG